MMKTQKTVKVIYSAVVAFTLMCYFLTSFFPNNYEIKNIFFLTNLIDNYIVSIATFFYLLFIEIIKLTLNKKIINKIYPICVIKNLNNHFELSEKLFKWFLFLITANTFLLNNEWTLYFYYNSPLMSWNDTEIIFLQLVIIFSIFINIFLWKIISYKFLYKSINSEIANTFYDLFDLIVIDKINSTESFINNKIKYENKLFIFNLMFKKNIENNISFNKIKINDEAGRTSNP